MSNLLDLASIVLTPTAYNNGEALCIKPDDGSGDFQFSRNSAATRVNAQGLVENVQTISGNLLDYSTFTSPSASWSLVGGLWVYDDTANGFILTPNIAVVVGDVFDVVVDVTIASGNANFRYASGNAQTTLFPFTDFVDGVNKFQATITGVDGNLERIFAPASLTDNPFTLNSISIKKISQDTNLPRINYEGFSYDGSGNVVPDSGCGSWLFEPQSTNLITQSELFSDATWTKVGGGAADDTIITSNYATSPDGTNNASRAQFNAVGTANGDRANLYANINVTSGQTFTMSFYGKSATATNEEVVLRMGSVQQVSVTLTQEYQRFSHTYTVTSSGAKNFGIQIRGNSAVTSADIIIWGFQVEQQSYATSYIPTSGSTVTRNQDVCTNGGSLASINSTEGVLYAEIAALADDADIKLFEINNGGTTDRVFIFYRSGTIRASVVVGGVTQCSFNITTNVTQFKKVALKYKENDFAFWINGVEVATDTSGITSSVGVLNNINFSNSGGGIPFYGKTKALAVWKEALTDAELTSLTTI